MLLAPTAATCLLLAPIISFAVSFLKRIPFVSHFPKIVVAICSVIATLWTAVASGGAVPTAQFIACVLTQISGAVATHEIVTKPAAKMIERAAGRAA